MTIAPPGSSRSAASATWRPATPLPAATKYGNEFDRQHQPEPPSGDTRKVVAGTDRELDIGETAAPPARFGYHRRRQVDCRDRADLAGQRPLDPADAAADVEPGDPLAQQLPFAKSLDDLRGGAIKRLLAAERIERDRCLRRDGNGAVELLADCTEVAAPVTGGETGLDQARRAFQAVALRRREAQQRVEWRVPGASFQPSEQCVDPSPGQQQMHQRDLGRPATGEITLKRRSGALGAGCERGLVHRHLRVRERFHRSTAPHAYL